MQFTERNAWNHLTEHAHTVNLQSMSDNKSHTLTNTSRFVTRACGIELDYSKQRIQDETLSYLANLANECELPAKIKALLKGDNVNNTERRPALHTALRNPDHHHAIHVNGENIVPLIHKTLEIMRNISDKIRSGLWLGYSGKPITDIVNIGIGGSDLGPRFCVHALGELASSALRYHFISDADPDSFSDIIANLHPETTLFIVSSKSFTTPETLFNTKKALSWFPNTSCINKHFIAVTAHEERARELGIDTILPIWSWVGGRYSASSAINLITMIAIGFAQFSQFLAGAHSMDMHFSEAPMMQNMPILLALLGIWNNNFLHINNLLLLTYSQRLKHFVPYIQQLDMESNGKSVDKQGRAVNYATGPIVWGGLGNQAQHSYYQLIYQGTHKIAADFISLRTMDGELMNKMCEDRIQTLYYGVHSQTDSNGYIPGNVPLNHLRLPDASPYSLGALIALYEHKVYCQSVIWDINPFDQPGVESAKRENIIHPQHTPELGEAQ